MYFHCMHSIAVRCSDLHKDGDFGLNFPTIGELESRIGFLWFGHSVLGRAGEDTHVQSSKYLDL